MSVRPWIDRLSTSERDFFPRFGRVVRANADLVESLGPPVSLGATCAIETDEGLLPAEVIGLRGGHLLLAPLAEVRELRPLACVRPEAFDAAPEASSLLGRVVDGLGRLLDSGPTLPPNTRPTAPREGLNERREVSEPIETGIRVVDGLLTCGRGQRLGIFAGAGVGKSSFLSMLLRSCRADAVVLALIGERSREVRRFLDQELDEDVRPRTIVVAATGAEPAMVRVRAAFLAADLADELRREGRHVLFITDSLTRLAMAQREVGLAAGEAPTSRGYPPSVFSMLPRLVEKAGASTTGSVTAFHAVLVEGDDLADPVADALRGLLDGHLVLSRELAEAGRFPALDVLSSLSRLMPDLVSAEQLGQARELRRLLGVHREVEDLVRVGAYRPGTDPDVDRALELLPRFVEFARQGLGETSSADDARSGLSQLIPSPEGEIP